MPGWWKKLSFLCSCQSQKVFLLTSFKSLLRSKLLWDLPALPTLYNNCIPDPPSQTPPSLPCPCPSLLFIYLFRATPAAYGGSQARGRIRSTATGLHHSHGSAGSLTHWARPGIKPTTSWMLVRFVSAEPWWELLSPLFFFNILHST